MVNGAAVDSLIWDYLATIHPELTSKVKGIDRFRPYGTPPVVTRPDLDPATKARLQEVLLNTHLHPRGKPGYMQNRTAEYSPCRRGAATRVVSPTRTARYAMSFVSQSVLQRRTGGLAGLVGILIDITAEREIAALRREFVYTAAHEFQTPLPAILGFADLLSDSANLTEELRCDYLAIVQERAEFLSRQVDKLLNVSRLENGGPLPLTLGPCPMDHLILQSLRSHEQTVQTHRFEWSLPSP